MMNETYDMHVTMRKADGTLARLAVLLHRQGYAPERLHLTLSEDGTREEIALTLRPFYAGRDVAVLTRQIARMYDVVAVHLHETGAKNQPQTVQELCHA